MAKAIYDISSSADEQYARGDAASLAKVFVSSAGESTFDFSKVCLDHEAEFRCTICEDLKTMMDEGKDALAACTHAMDRTPWLQSCAVAKP